MGKSIPSVVHSGFSHDRGKGGYSWESLQECLSLYTLKYCICPLSKRGKTGRENPTEKGYRLGPEKKCPWGKHNFLIPMRGLPMGEVSKERSNDEYGRHEEGPLYTMTS